MQLKLRFSYAIIIVACRSYVLLGDMGNFKSQQRQRSINAELKTPVRVSSSEGIGVKHTDDNGQVMPSAACIEEPDSTVQPRVCLSNI